VSNLRRYCSAASTAINEDVQSLHRADDVENPMPRTLADRLQSHAQQKARLAEREMLLKEAERKARTRRLIEAGGLVEKAGLLELEPNALYGAVLSLRDRADDAEQIREWAALGGRAFAREARAEDEAKEPVAVSFPAPVARGVASALRAAGLRFNRLREEWAAPISIKPRPSQKTTAAPSAASVQRPWQRPLNRACQRLPRAPMLRLSKCRKSGGCH
jgi:hypothetical protein